MTRLRRWLTTLRPGDLFTLPVMFGVVAEFVLVQVASPYTTPGSLLPLTLLQVLAVILTFSMLFPVYLLLRHRATENTMRAVLLIGLPLCALASGVLVAWLRLRLGLEPVGFVALRAFTSVMHITAVSVLLWMAVSGLRLHYIRLTRLTQERDVLAALEQQTSDNLAELDTEKTEAVRSRILGNLASSASNNVNEVLATLNTTLEETVRPLSRQLESQTEDWIEPTSQPELREVRRIDWKAAAAEGTQPALFSPLGVLTVVTLIGTPMNIARVGFVFASLFAVLTFVIAVPLAILIRRLFVRFTHRSAGITRATVFVSMCVIIGITWAVVLLPITVGTALPLRFFYLLPIFVLIIAFIWGVAVAAQRQALATDLAMEAASADLLWRVAVSRELHRQRRRALAHAVHGEVQAALAAGILELDQTERDGTVAETQIMTVRERIVKCVRNLDLRGIHPSPLHIVTAKVQATWTGVITLKVKVDPVLKTALDTDARCLMTLNDVIPELVFNSIKHGNATRITITLDMPDYRTLRLTALDNGSSVNAPTKSGMGSRLLDTCAIEWSRTKTPEGTMTTALLPFAPTHDEDPSERFEGFPLETGNLSNAPA